MPNEKRTSRSMSELFASLLERDMILGDKDEAKELVDYTNKKGYNAEYFEYRNRPHVRLEREKPHRPTDKPILNKKKPTS